jgi:hypothetical protein
MSDYAQITLFTPKDALITGNPLKLVRGSEVDAELAAIAVAIATKYDSTDFAIPTLANPTGTVGLAAVNGVATTYMRSDAAPVLSQAIAPTWSGQHTWSLALRAPDGLVGTPAFTFATDPDTGLWRAGANDLRVSAGGSFIGQWSATGAYHLYQDGNAGGPSVSFFADTDTGIYRVGADQLGMSCGGVIQARFRSNTLDLYVGGSIKSQLQNGLVYVDDGVASGPAYSFLNEVGAGFYRAGADNIRYAATGSIVVMQLSSTGGFWNADGTNGNAGSPNFSFVGDTNTGIYRRGADQLGFAEGGVGYSVGFRPVPRSTTATTLAIGDVGKCVAITAAINIPASVFSAGDVVSVYNDSAGALNITISAGTLRLAGTASTGTRSLASRGIATLWFNVGGATPEVVASGNVS